MRPKKKQPKKKSTIEKNITAVYSNTITEWSRTHVFETGGHVPLDDNFRKWEKHITGKMRVRFQRKQITAAEKGRGSWSWPTFISRRQSIC